MTQEKTLIGHVDLTPTWSQMLPSMLLLREEGDSGGRATANHELSRMAALADKYVESCKANDIYVIMGGDYPAAVCHTKEEADAYIAAKNAEGGRAYWRSYTFTKTNKAGERK